MFEKYSEDEAICIKCGKKIEGWGIDGCPVVENYDNEKGLGLLMGLTNIDGWKCYKCQVKELRKSGKKLTKENKDFIAIIEEENRVV